MDVGVLREKLDKADEDDQRPFVPSFPVLRIIHFVAFPFIAGRLTRRIASSGGITVLGIVAIALQERSFRVGLLLSRIPLSICSIGHSKYCEVDAFTLL